jgi:ankyrin repeat protein
MKEKFIDLVKHYDEKVFKSFIQTDEFKSFINTFYDNIDGSTPLEYVAEHGNAQCFKLFLKDELERRAFGFGSSQEVFVMEKVIKGNNKESLIELLNNGANVNVYSSDGSLLHTVVKSGNIEFADILLKAGADFNITDDYGQTAVEVAKHYLNGAVKDEMLTLIQDASLIEESFKAEIKKIVKDLREYRIFDMDVNHIKHTFREYTVKALINKPIIDGLTPLEYAIKESAYLALEGLIKIGADINHQDKNGKTALHHAAEYNKDEKWFNKLFERGADANIQDHEGLTCLHIAAQNTNDIDFFKILSKQENIDYTITDHNRNTSQLVALKKLKQLKHENTLKNNVPLINSEAKIREAEDIINILKVDLETQLKKQKFPDLTPGKQKYNIGEILKSVSRTYSPNHRKDFDHMIDTACSVAEAAAAKGDISLKANLMYYAANALEHLADSKRPKTIKAIDAGSVAHNDFSLAGGWASENTIALSFTPTDLQWSVGCLMHEVLHDTIRTIYGNDASPSYKLSAEANIKSNPRDLIQLESFTQDMKDLHKVRDNFFSKEEQEASAETKSNFSSILDELYVNEQDVSKASLVRSEKIGDKEITYDKNTARKEMYNYLFSQKAEGYTEDYLKNGTISKDSNAAKYAPNIVRSFEQDFTVFMLPEVLNKLEQIEKNGKLKLEETDLFKEQANKHITNSKKGIKNRIEKTQSPVEETIDTNRQKKEDSNYQGKLKDKKAEKNKLAALGQQFRNNLGNEFADKVAKKFGNKVDETSTIKSHANYREVKSSGKSTGQNL